MLDDGALLPDSARRQAVERAWDHLIGAGPILTAAQRHEVISVARVAWAGSVAPDPASGVPGEAAFWLASDAEGLRRTTIDDFENRGLDRFAYLEIVGIVGLLANVDFYARGLGTEPPRLPEPDGAAPTGDIHPDAELATLWVPSAGTPYAPHVLDALPSEGLALRDLHESMYVEMRSVGDSTYADVLTKVQIEYVAARTSYLNECFY